MSRWCRMLRRPHTPPPVPEATVVHIGAKSPDRRWDPERFAQVATELEREGHEVVATGQDVEWSGPGRNLLGRLDLEQLAALVADARVVVSGNTGVAHLATAYSRPSVALFGPMSPRLWGPPKDPLHRVLWDPVTRSLDAITVDEVLSAVRMQAERLP
ncbi:MAG TPA: glycosyltransferase family 9 protein [Candidatus Limnocylindrales bacterium]|nr:glycosyltransferase family 9 protein [Candidatus Limnocylindrales bacterium]